MYYIKDRCISKYTRREREMGYYASSHCVYIGIINTLGWNVGLRWLYRTIYRTNFICLIKYAPIIALTWGTIERNSEHGTCIAKWVFHIFFYHIYGTWSRAINPVLAVILTYYFEFFLKCKKILFKNKTFLLATILPKDSNPIQAWR